MDAFIRNVIRWLHVHNVSALQVQQVYSLAPAGILGHLTVTVLVTVLYIPLTHPGILLWWSSISLIILGARGLTTIRYRIAHKRAGVDHLRDKDTAARWALWYLLGALGTSISWGISVVLLEYTAVRDTDFFIVAVALGLAGASVVTLGPILSIFCAFVIPMLTLVAAWLFLQNTIFHIGAGIGMVIGLCYLLYTGFTHNRAIARIIAQNRSFARFVPDDMLRILQKPSILDVALGQHRSCAMTILFADIRNFTTLAESLPPQETFNILNAYLGRVGPIVRHHRGFIDKYIGDAILALFPETPDDAVQAAIAIQRALTEYNRQHTLRGERPIEVGIGIHCGETILGLIGETERLEGTVISDAVNVASRLESLTKVYQTPVLLSEDVWGHVAEPSKYQSRFVDKVRVKGRTATLAILEIYDGRDPVRRDAITASREHFERALAAYALHDYQTALVYFQEIADSNQGDHLVSLYVNRCVYALERGSLPDQEPGRPFFGFNGPGIEQIE